MKQGSKITRLRNQIDLSMENKTENLVSKRKTRKTKLMYQFSSELQLLIQRIGGREEEGVTFCK